MARARGDYETDLPERLGVPGFDTVPQLLDVAGPNVLCICSATAEHKEHTLLAASAGAHVLCERPIALDLQQAREMQEAASRAKSILMIGHVLRFWPEYVMAKTLIDSGELGRILSVTTQRVSGTLSAQWQQRLLDNHLGLGALEALVHDMDYLAWLLGPPTAVYAQGLQSDSGAWGQAQCLLKFQNQEQALAEASYLVPLTFPLSMHLRVLAEGGTLVYDFRGALSSRGTSTRSLVLTRTNGTPEVLDVPPADAYTEEVAYFLRCIEERRRPELGTPEQAKLALEVLLATASSAQTDAIILLPSS